MASSQTVAEVAATEARPTGLYWRSLGDATITPIVRGIGIAALLNVAVGLYMAFLYAPREAKTGDVQRIFYFHVPSAWVGFLAFFVVFVGSLMYLWRRERRWDALALASAEIGVIFTSLVLLTGPLWAKGTWGVFWEWEPRLTTTLILWMIYVGYLMLRGSAPGDRQARFAAVLGIIGFIDVPIIFFAVTLWRTMHPTQLIFEAGGLEPRMTQTLMVCLLSFTLVYLYFLIQRVRIEQTRDQVSALQAEMD